MISKSTIDAIFDATRVEEVIGEFVHLKRAGSTLKGLSPFSNEKTPSFVVSPSKQIWKDFSSGKGGSAISFLMEHEHFSYPEALRYLAKKYNIEIEETEQTDEETALINERESLYIVSEFANKYFQEILHETDLGRSIGLSYFKERGFTNETIKKFNLGYSLDQWDAFTNKAIESGYNIEYLQKTGLTIVREDGNKIDRFKGRVIFPIQSKSGRVLGFGGRILSNEKKVAKYLNSPESDIYHKSKVLYGIFHAKQSIARENNCYLVEGYTDVIQLSQAGIENVVSSSGTALTVDQVRLIQGLTKNITLLFDGDAAGIRASLRGVDIILEAGMNVRICTFPLGEDPDSFARKTPTEELKNYLKENATDFIRFKASLLMEEAQNDPIRKADLIRDMVSSISKISDRIQREIYVQECSKIMDISEEVLFNSLAQIARNELLETNKKAQQQNKLEIVKSASHPETDSNKVDILYLLERKIIEILLLYGNLEDRYYDLHHIENEENELELVQKSYDRNVFEQIYLSLQEDELEFSNPTFRLIYEDILSYYQTHHVWNLEDYLAKLKPELSEEITSIIMEEERYQLHNWERQNIFVKPKSHAIGQYVTETIITLRWYLLDRKINYYKELLSKENDSNERIQILEDVMDHTKLSKLFATKIGRVLSRF